MENPEFRLRIDAHALVQLGEQLITDDEQALLELVKNSYDADADWARIRIDSEYVPQKNDHVPPAALGLIEIEDNGIGMNQKAIERGWLMISLSLKREQKFKGVRTKIHNRLPLGDKGLGRLGTMKLGKFLSLETRNSPTQDGWLVTFQWSDVKSGTPLDEVPIFKLRIPSNGQTGTIVRIFGLKELNNWRTEKRKRRLEVKLSGLISPFQTNNNFEVKLNINGRDGDLVRIGTGLRNTATMLFDYDWNSKRLRLTGKLKLLWFKKKNKDGYDRFIARDEGRELFKLLKTNILLDKEFLLELSTDASWYITISKEIASEDIPFKNDDAADPGPFSGSFDYFDLDTDIKVPKLFFENASDYRALIKELAQIFVYRDGFGIRMPNDWLRLGSAWTSGGGYYSLKPSNVIGFFAISVENNPMLVEKSDREGFADNEGWKGFNKLATIITTTVNKALNRFGRTSTEFLNEKTGVHVAEDEEANNYGQLVNKLNVLVESSETVGRHFDENSKSRIYALRKIAGDARMVSINLKESDDRRTKAKNVLETAERLENDFASDSKKVEVLTKELSNQKNLAAIIRKRIDSFQERSELLYEMVAVGLSAQALAHDVPAMLYHLGDQAKLLAKLGKSTRVDSEKLIATANEMKTSIDAIEQMIDFVRPMLRGRRLSKKRDRVSQFVKSFFDLRGSRLLSHGIKWHVEDEGIKDFEISFNPGRFIQTLDNLTTNSEYWLQHYYGGDIKNSRITIEIHDPELIFFDNGKGIRPDLEESLFEMFTSGKEGEEGNGLGLFITRELLLRDNCTISIDPARNKHERLYRFVINFSGVKK